MRYPFVNEYVLRREVPGLWQPEVRIRQELMSGQPYGTPPNVFLQKPGFFPSCRTKRLEEWRALTRREIERYSPFVPTE